MADEVARRRPGPATSDDDRIEPDGEAQPGRSHVRMAALGRGILTVLQSILAVAFGAGLFIAFDQLWRWNALVALVLSVLVILGLVVGVRVVRKTEDIASTLIAVAVGALITLGPMALLQTG
jgi:membrane protein YdbS with pleckstrin-like domain